MFKMSGHGRCLLCWSKRICKCRSVLSRRDLPALVPKGFLLLLIVGDFCRFNKRPVGGVTRRFVWGKVCASVNPAARAWQLTSLWGGLSLLGQFVAGLPIVGKVAWVPYIT